MIASIERVEPGPRMSRAVVHGNTVYTCGHVDNNGTTVTEQTQNILARIEKVLADAGSDKAHILSVNIWLADIATFDEMNAVYDAWVDRSQPPARACVESRLAGEAYKVEIAVIAALRTGG